MLVCVIYAGDSVFHRGEGDSFSRILEEVKRRFCRVI